MSRLPIDFDHGTINNSHARNLREQPSFQGHYCGLKRLSGGKDVRLRCRGALYRTRIQSGDGSTQSSSSVSMRCSILSRRPTIRLWQNTPVSKLQMGSNPIPGAYGWLGRLAWPLRTAFRVRPEQTRSRFVPISKNLVHEFSLFVGRAFTSYE